MRAQVGIALFGAVGAAGLVWTTALAANSNCHFNSNPTSGDWDYMLFVPDMRDRWDWFICTKNGDGTMTLEWNDGGTLRAAVSVLGPWVEVTGALSPFTVLPTERMVFFRLER